MAVSIFNCWACGESLLYRTDEQSEAHFFHCDQNCEDAYNAKMAARAKAYKRAQDAQERAWKKADEEKQASLKAMREGKKLPKPVAKPKKKTRKKKKKAGKRGRPRKPTVSSRRRVRRMGEAPANSPVRRQVTCTLCGKKGHNVRTCKKVK
jgi:hypothetical protein